MYAIFREVNNNRSIKYVAENFHVDEVTFNEVLITLKEENIMKGISVMPSDNKTSVTVIGKPRITLTGIEFLDVNNTLYKTYKGLKEICDWLPF